MQQILLHKTVQRLVLLDRDPWIEEDSTAHCRRLEPITQEAAEWFERSPPKTADVVFIQAGKNTNRSIVVGAKRALKEDGMLVIQTQSLAERPLKWEWIDELTTYSNDTFPASIDTTKEYQFADTDFLVAFHGDALLGRWFANEAQVNLAIREQLATPLPHFDGSTMLSFQYPSRAAEDVFCERHPTDSTCQMGHGLDPSKELIPINSFEVKASTIQNAGRRAHV